MRFLVLFFSLSCFASEPINVVQFGDSLGASVFAGTAGIKNVDYIDRQGGFFRKLLLWAVENREYNYGTGSQDYSVISRLEHLGFTVNAFNASVSGGTINTVATKELFAAEEWRKGRQINLSIILISANDVCHNIPTDLNNFADDYRRVADYMKNANTKIFLPLPDITKIYEFKDKRSAFGIKCKSIWKITKSCENVMGGKNLDLVRQRITEFNAIIKQESDRVGGIYVDSLETAKIESKHISKTDCFHLGQEGHKMLSDLVWEKIEVK